MNLDVIVSILEDYIKTKQADRTLDKDEKKFIEEYIAWIRQGYRFYKHN